MRNLTASVRPPLVSLAASVGIADAKIESSGVIYDNLFDYASGQYSQTKTATTGYDSMSVEIIVPEFDTRRWISQGLGRHIEVYASSGRVWEGFVNEISINIGPVSMVIGPLMDIANRIKVVYTTKRWDTNPPIGGEQAETAFATDEESGVRWGTFERIISGGEGYATTMEALRDSKLVELAWPKISQNFSTGSQQPMTITLSCLGYYYYMERFLFDDSTAASGSINLSTKIADVLNADPDGLFASANASIESNTLQVPDFDDGTKTGLQAIQELVGLGFTSGQRALFSVGNDRFVTYQSLAVDKQHEYVYSIYDELASIMYRNESIPEPWDIRPGEWLRLQSINARPFSPTLPRHSDPGYMFIESITFTTPNDIQIQGGLGNTLKSKIARLGLAFSEG